MSEPEFTFTEDEGAAIVALNPIKVVTVQLTDAQIKALPTVKVTLVPTDANKCFTPLYAYIVCDARAGAYHTVGGPLVRINSSANAVIAENVAQNYPLISDGDAVKVYGMLALGDEVVHGSLMNTALSHTITIDVYSPTLDPSLAITGGHADNTLSVRLWYMEMPIVPFTAAD